MENLIDVLKKGSEFEVYVECLPDVIQEIILAGYEKDGEFHKISWQHDPVDLLANIRQSFQDLVTMIEHEKSRLNP